MVQPDDLLFPCPTVFHLFWLSLPAAEQGGRYMQLGQEYSKEGFESWSAIFDIFLCYMAFENTFCQFDQCSDWQAI